MKVNIQKPTAHLLKSMPHRWCECRRGCYNAVTSSIHRLYSVARRPSCSKCQRRMREMTKEEIEEAGLIESV